MIVERGCFLSGEEACGQPNRPDQVGADDGLGVGEIDGVRGEVLGAHDAGVVDEDVERWVSPRRSLGEGLDGDGVFDVERERLHAGVGFRRLVEHGLAAAGDDDLVALLGMLPLGRGRCRNRRR